MSQKVGHSWTKEGLSQKLFGAFSRLWISEMKRYLQNLKTIWKVRFTAQLYTPENHSLLIKFSQNFAKKLAAGHDFSWSSKCLQKTYVLTNFYIKKLTFYECRKYSGHFTMFLWMFDQKLQTFFHEEKRQKMILKNHLF